jgi:hypothetical protein
MASIADPAVKAQAWKDITDPKCTLSSKAKEAMMHGFYSWSQFELVQPYFDKYYEELKDFDKRHSNQYVNVFLRLMRPTMEILDSHIVKLVTIKGEVPDTNTAYKKKLEENIELLLRAQTLREMALKD